MSNKTEVERALNEDKTKLHLTFLAYFLKSFMTDSKVGGKDIWKFFKNTISDGIGH